MLDSPLRRRGKLERDALARQLSGVEQDEGETLHKFGHGHVEELAVVQRAEAYGYLRRIGVAFHDFRRLPHREFSEPARRLVSAVEIRYAAAHRSDIHLPGFKFTPDGVAQLGLFRHDAPPNGRLRLPLAQ